MKLSDLTPLPKNPRKITEAAIEKLKNSIKKDGKFMAARPIIVDPEGVILGGNQRHRACIELGMNEVPKEWVKRVDWTEDEARRFAVVDNAPPGMSGEFDMDLLVNQYTMDELVDMGFEKTDVVDDTYTKKITAPLYEPKGEKPDIEDLINREKTDLLIKEISLAELPEDISRFLVMAAERHTAFHFRNIAEFYCHADIKIQDLMEKSGLVIIDFDKAIEFGFVNMTDRMGSVVDIEEMNDDA